MEQAIEYKCERCGYDTPQKGNLVTHLKAKTPCTVKFSNISREVLLEGLKKPPPTHTRTKCTSCDKEISKHNVARHRSTCKGKKTDTASSSLSNDKIVEELRDEVKGLRADLAKLLQIPGVVNNITNNNINNTLNINMNSYGNEDISHLTHDMLSHCLFNPSKGLPQLIDNIHYNPNVPTNHNLRFKSSKHNSFEKLIGEQWHECDASNTLDELIRKGYKVLNAHYAEFYMTNPEYTENEMKQRALERFRFLSDKTSNEYHSVKRDLRLLVKDRTMYVIGLPLQNEPIIQLNEEGDQEITINYDVPVDTLPYVEE